MRGMNRILSKVDQTPDGCWNWTGRLNRDGYAVSSIGNRAIYVHRWIWEQDNQPLPSNITLDHLCRNRACVNPAHLEPVSRRTNTIRGFYGILDRSRMQTPYLGVRRNRSKFSPRLTVNGVCHHLGSYRTPEEAALVYDDAVRRLIGPDAPTNASLGLLAVAS